MRYVVLGDIHGNYYALEAVLEDIKNEYLKEFFSQNRYGNVVSDDDKTRSI